MTDDPNPIPTDSPAPAEAEDAASPPAPVPPAKGRSWVGWAKFAGRWLIAIVGVAWVISGLTIRDRVYVMVEDDAGRPLLLDAPLLEPFDPKTDEVAIYQDPRTGDTAEAPADALINGPDRDTINIFTDEGREEVHLAGMRLSEPPRSRRNEMPRVEALYVYSERAADDPATAFHVQEVPPVAYAGEYQLKTPQPIVRIGLASMVRNARPVLLTLSVLVFPITLIATGLRWWRLMRPLGIEMSLGRAYVLNMVGLFYNSFMLGSTGGDFIKAYYAGKHARPGLKTAAWFSVFIDRVVGLIVLVLIGGTAATVQWLLVPDKESAVAVASRQVMWASGTLLIAATVGIWVASHQPVRRKTGISFVLHRIGREGGRVRDTLQSVQDVIETYRQRPLLVLEVCLLTVPVHVSVIISAMLAGWAFDLPIPWPYYFVCVPVIVLSASIPISPQGAGVMEFFAVLLTRPQGATVAQAFALALSIRVVQILWNLTGGIFILRGGFSAPAEVEGDESVLPESPVSAAA